MCPHGLVDVVFLLHTTRDNAHRSEAVKRALGRLVSALGPLGPQAVQVWPQRQPDSYLSLPLPTLGSTPTTVSPPPPPPWTPAFCLPFPRLHAARQVTGLELLSSLPCRHC